MAWAMKCDRCGKYYDHHPDDADGVAVLSYDRETDTYHNDENFDLCPDCIKSFDEWFENRNYRAT